MNLFSRTIDMNDLNILLESRENILLVTIEKTIKKDDKKLDSLIEGISSLDKGLNTLSATVAANHSAALLGTQNMRAELTKEMSKEYATKIDLSNGLNSLRSTAKLVWVVVITVTSAAVYLSSKGII